MFVQVVAQEVGQSVSTACEVKKKRSEEADKVAQLKRKEQGQSGRFLFSCLFALLVSVSSE